MTVLSSPNQPVNCGPKDISTDIPRMNAWNCAKASIPLDFRQTTVVLRRLPRWTLRMHLHLVWVLRGTGGDQLGFAT